MNDAKLEQLLRQADDFGESPAGDAPVLVEKLMRIDRRRSRIRRGVQFAVVAIAAGALAYRAAPPKQGNPIATNVPTTHSPAIKPQVIASQTITAQLAELESQAAVHGVVADRLIAAQRAAAAVVSRPDPLAAIALERERTAMILITSGDWHSAADPATARREYRRASELFPNTCAAAIARDRLDKLNMRKDG